MSICRVLIFAFVFLFHSLTFASVTVPNDEPYLGLRHQGTLYVFDAKSGEFIDQVAAYTLAIRTMYEKSFNWRLDESMDLVLTSPRQQVANAYATVIPNVKTVWFPSGAALLEEFAQSSWLLTLATHEIAHLYQLNAKPPLTAGLKKVVGNPLVIFPFLPIFIHPNLFAPGFMIEGNAVMNESRLNMGGRLHSGEKRALVLAQIKNKEIDPNRLINDHFRFPFGNVRYLQGGYFNAHLAAKYGVEKANGFFIKQSEHYFWPLRLNSTFRDHFGSSYPQEIREYVRNLEGLAKNQVATEAAPALESTFISPMNHDAKKIWFLADDGLSPPVLHTFNKSDQKWTSRPVDMLTGKVFEIDGQPFSAASFNHNLHRIENSLYGEGLKLLDKYRGQIVTDMRAGKVVSLDGGNAWLEPRVLVSGENFDVAHSNPILDDQGHIYYFRQNGAVRLLFKNREPLFKYDGFYGKLMEVGADGSVYFIANTDYGSSLYRLSKNEVQRLLVSDRVIDARLINDTQALVTEVAANGHEVHILPIESKAALPANYSYGFTTETLLPEPSLTAEDVRKNQRPYSSFKEIRFSGMDLATAYSSFDGLSTALLASFNDPLEYQNVVLGYSATTAKPYPQQALASYAFTKWLPDFYLRYLYDEAEWSRRDGIEQLSFNQEVLAGVKQLLLRWRRWDADVSFDATYENIDTKKDWQSLVARPFREETYGVQSKAQLQYSFAPALGMQPWRGFNLSFKNRLESDINEWTKKYNTSIVESKYVHGFKDEFYVTAMGAYAWAENRDIRVDYNPLGFSERVSLPLLTSGRIYDVKSGGFFRLEFEKVISFRSYSTRLPFGINRFSPFVIAQVETFDDDPRDEYPTDDFEYGYGANLDLLFLHQVHVPLRILFGFSTRFPTEVESEFSVGFKKTF